MLISSLKFSGSQAVGFPPTQTCIFQAEMEKGVRLGEGRWLALLLPRRALGTPHRTSLSPRAKPTKQESWRCSKLPPGRAGPWQVLPVLSTEVTDF